jgi:glycosyltransferase domain-containing protein
MNLTIALPTFNRPDFLKRHLGFLARLNFTYPIVVLDGSNEANQKINRSIIEKNNSLKITHDCYPESLNQTVRIQKGFEKIHTKYSVIIADDDFLLPSSLELCISFLEKNEDYVSVCGRAPCFFVRSTPLNISLLAMVDFLGNNFSNSFNSPIKRLVANSVLTGVGQPPLYYTMKRTDVIKTAFEFADQTIQYSAMEGVFNGYTLIKGKHKVLDVTFSLRDYSSTPIFDQHRDGMKDDGKYVSNASEQAMFDFFSRKGISPEYFDYIHPKDGNYVGDPENIKALEQLLPFLYKAKKIQYVINFFTNYYLRIRFGIIDKELRALKAVI